MDTIVTHICNIQQYQGVKSSNHVVPYFDIGFLLAAMGYEIPKSSEHSPLKTVACLSLLFWITSSIIDHLLKIEQSNNHSSLIHRSSIIHHCIHHCIHLLIIKITIKSLKHRKWNHKSISQSSQSSINHHHQSSKSNILNHQSNIINSSGYDRNQSNWINHQSINRHHQIILSSNQQSNQINHHQNQTIIKSTIKSNQSSSKSNYHQINNQIKSIIITIKLSSNQQSNQINHHHYHG